MSDKDLYMPLFYTSLELTESLSDAEFGRVVRSLLKKLGGRGSAEEETLPQASRIAYNFMLEGAKRIIGRQVYGKKVNNMPEPKRYGNFDPKAAFEKALERSYGKRAVTDDRSGDGTEEKRTVPNEKMRQS